MVIFNKAEAKGSFKGKIQEDYIGYSEITLAQSGLFVFHGQY